MNGHDVDGPARYLLVFEQEHLVIMDRPCPYLRDELVHVFADYQGEGIYVVDQYRTDTHILVNHAQDHDGSSHSSS